MSHRKIVVYVDDSCEACSLMLRMLQDFDIPYRSTTNLNVLIHRGINKIPTIRYKNKYYSGHEAFICVKKIADDRLNGGRNFGKKKMDQFKRN